jgi:putative chitinase
MSEWKEFLQPPEENPHAFAADGPGLVMISFLNRYLEPLSAIKYRVQCDGIEINGSTTEDDHVVEIQPLSAEPVRVFVWSRMQGQFKLIDEFRPLVGRRLLINERMKTFKHDSKTERHQAVPPGGESCTVPATESAGHAKTGDRPIQEAQGVELVLAKNERDEPEHQTRRSSSNQIQVEQLKKIFPAASDIYLGKIADELNADLAGYKLDTVLRRAHFFAQVRQEAGAALSAKEEVLNYRPEVLVEKFSYYAAHPVESKSDGRLEEEIKIDEKNGKKSKRAVKKKIVTQAADQPAIANKAYGGRGGNGGATSGDGWKFRGRGIFQLTTHDNYRDFNKEYPKYWPNDQIDFLSTPDKICEFPYLIRSAIWYWVRRAVYSEADGGSEDANVDAVTKRINGPAMDAAASRRKNFHQLCYPAFK